VKADLGESIHHVSKQQPDTVYYMGRKYRKIMLPPPSPGLLGRKHRKIFPVVALLNARGLSKSPKYTCFSSRPRPHIHGGWLAATTPPPSPGRGDEPPCSRRHSPTSTPARSRRRASVTVLVEGMGKRADHETGGRFRRAGRPRSRAPRARWGRARRRRRRRAPRG